MSNDKFLDFKLKSENVPTYTVEISTLRHKEDILYLQDPVEVKMNTICAQCRYGTCYANKVGTQVLSTPVAITPYITTSAIPRYKYIASVSFHMYTVYISFKCTRLL